jgi:flagellar basal-body rod modification protein FlgD
MQVQHHPSNNMTNMTANKMPSAITAQDSSSGSGSSDSAAGSANITANDFLELLVAEMKNQDPTADTDPNAYIDQLVQVNSLQQLISINQDLGGGGSSDSSDASTAPSRAIGAASRLATSLASGQSHSANTLHDSNAASTKTTVHQV